MNASKKKEDVRQGEIRPAIAESKLVSAEAVDSPSPAALAMPSGFCEVAIFASRVTSLSGGRFGPVVRTKDWPYPIGTDPTAGLGAETLRYSTSSEAPVCFSLRILQSGARVWLRKALSHGDESGRSGAEVIHALLDRSGSLDIRGSLMLREACEQADLWSIPDERLPEGYIEPISIPQLDADYSRASLALDVPAQAVRIMAALLTYLTGGKPVTAMMSDSSEAEALIEILARVFPRRVLQNVSYSTFEQDDASSAISLILLREELSTLTRSKRTVVLADGEIGAEYAANVASAEFLVDRYVRGGPSAPDGLDIASFIAWIAAQMGVAIPPNEAQGGQVDALIEGGLAAEWIERFGPPAVSVLASHLLTRRDASVGGLPPQVGAAVKKEVLARLLSAATDGRPDLSGEALFNRLALEPTELHTALLEHAVALAEQDSLSPRNAVLAPLLDRAFWMLSPRARHDWLYVSIDAGVVPKGPDWDRTVVATVLGAKGDDVRLRERCGELVVISPGEVAAIIDDLILTHTRTPDEIVEALVALPKVNGRSLVDCALSAREVPLERSLHRIVNLSDKPEAQELVAYAARDKLWSHINIGPDIRPRVSAGVAAVDPSLDVTRDASKRRWSLTWPWDRSDTSQKNKQDGAHENP